MMEARAIHEAIFAATCNAICDISFILIKRIKTHIYTAFYYSLSKHGLESSLKSLFYLFVHVYAVLCTVHGQWTHCISV
jgi:hypothetical protein